MQRGLRLINLQWAIEKSPILLLQYWKNEWLGGNIIISYFGGSNNIFADCTYFDTHILFQSFQTNTVKIYFFPLNFFLLFSNIYEKGYWSSSIGLVIFLKYMNKNNIFKIWYFFKIFRKALIRTFHTSFMTFVNSQH